GTSQHAGDYPFLDLYLHALHDPRWPQAAALDTGEFHVSQLPFEQGTGKDIGSGNCVLDGEIDADAADRRHGMRRVADAQHARLVPCDQPVDSDGQLPEVLEAHDFAGAIGQERRQLGDGAADRVEPLRLHCFQRIFGDDEAALPVVTAIDPDEDVTSAETTNRFVGIGGLAREAKPQHIHWRAEVLDLQAGLASHRRMPTVAAEDQIARY